MFEYNTILLSRICLCGFVFVIDRRDTVQIFHFACCAVVMGH